jgi:hypothetical protein
MSSGQPHRQARLAEALRANLRRRKSQARARPDAPDMIDGPHAEASEDRDPPR